MSQDILMPNIGDFEGVEIIEVLVKPGDRIEPEQPLLTLESDKATMDIPSPAAGEVAELCVKSGQKVSEGALILRLAADSTEAASPAAEAPSRPAPQTPVEPAPRPAATAPAPTGNGEYDADVVVLGAGPGGYTAAFRAADLGLRTILIERYPDLGGVCLNVGCIPSKALLHVAKVISEVEELKQHGIDLGARRPDPGPARQWAESVINKLTGGLKFMAKQRKVEVLRGYGRFASANSISLEQADASRAISFKHAIIAAGSRPATLPFLPDDPRIMDSTGALRLDTIPERLLVIGGGIIGLEMAAVYAALGARITIVEMAGALIPGCDQDIVQPLHKRIKKRYENIFLNTGVSGVKAGKGGLGVSFEGKGAPAEDRFDALLVAVGRRPNGGRIGAETAGVRVDERGFIPVDEQQRTNVPHILAIGDIAGQPMLAHKASHEAKLAAEVIAGHKASFDDRVIPSVAYTDPEVAWVGLSETEAREQGIEYGQGVVPWAASGRSLALGRDEGVTKILFDKTSKRILGAAIAGPNAGDLIAECALAIEMGADAEDIGLTIHPHPTLSETVAMAAEAFEGTITDLYLPRR